MNEWISVKDRLPKTQDAVDLWIVGEPVWIGFYDPSRDDKRSCRTTNWFLFGGKWRCAGGLSSNLSPEVRVTHWMPLPEPPKEQL